MTRVLIVYRNRIHSNEDGTLLAYHETRAGAEQHEERAREQRGDDITAAAIDEVHVPITKSGLVNWLRTQTPDRDNG